ncbi:MAG: DNA/RNA helicase domain-containing protein [Planctomycetota bacterium]
MSTGAGSAWYSKGRQEFLDDSVHVVVGMLARNAIAQGLHVEIEQHDEWHSSIGVLQHELGKRALEIDLLKSTLSAPELAEYRHVILEYDFRRRGLRMDCVLLGDGIVAVLEFKRAKLTAGDREQVSSYCINLVEFHEETRRLVKDEDTIVAPILALTSGVLVEANAPTGSGADFHRAPWGAVLRKPFRCDGSSLHKVLVEALAARRARKLIDSERWLSSRFSPSSTILDAAISLYGQHDVSAISAHAAPVERIQACTSEVAGYVERALREKTNRIVFVSGAPGAGKTLVGLKLAFDARFRKDAVFVTGNAPLVEVLSEALKSAYAKPSKRKGGLVASGYSSEDAQRVIGMSTFKLVKAHTFLGERGSTTGAADGRVVIFDEAQRTYKKGRFVLGKPLKADEAKLILDSLVRSYGAGVCVVALVGHNQAINSGELGIVAWFQAARECGWRFAISDETLALAEVASSGEWSLDPLRERLRAGHLPHSLRYYRNGDLERWADLVLSEDTDAASELAVQLDVRGDTVWLVRDLAAARDWVRARRVGEERAGIIASGQARRLAAEGLFVDLKPDIAHWMLAPSDDIRSATMLETVQNQYQVQGLEIDYSIVAWDADLRREGGAWRSYKLSGADWRRDKELDIAKNGYRVLLTRARKGMVVFVPQGDLSGDDATRSPQFYDSIAEHLLRCGARQPRDGS